MFSSEASNLSHIKGSFYIICFLKGMNLNIAEEVFCFLVDQEALLFDLVSSVSSSQMQ